MKAIRIHEFGGPDVLKLDDIEVPQPAANEVLIKVYASTVNPLDQNIFEGKSQVKFPTHFPLTVGWDVSDVIETGEKVKNFTASDEVYAVSISYYQWSFC